MDSWTGWLRYGLLLFWTLWITIVFVTNLIDGFRALGRLPDEAQELASRNYRAIRRSLKKFSPPGWLPGFLFAGVLLWQALIVVLFWRAAATFPAQGITSIYPPFAANLALWAAFMLTDEIIREYDSQSMHLMLFIAQLVTVISIHLIS